MKIRIFRVLGIGVVALSVTGFKGQPDNNSFRLTEGRISYVKTELKNDLLVERNESLSHLCNRVNKNIEREADYCDPVYFEEMVVKVCDGEALGVLALEGKISGSYQKHWYSNVEFDKDKIDKHGSEAEKKAAEKIIALKEHGAKHAFDFTINFVCI